MNHGTTVFARIFRARQATLAVFPIAAIGATVAVASRHRPSENASNTGGQTTNRETLPQRATIDLRIRTAKNRLAYIPPQCFTKAQSASDETPRNPCYVCHGEGREPNFSSESALQLAYDFPAVRGGHGTLNEWTNLFVDRSAAMRRISDEKVRRYVSEDNYLVS